MKIADTVTPTDYTVLTTAGENEVHLRVVDSGQRGQNALAQLPRAEFIRAIETELDGTWIDHADLPEVTEDSDRPGNYDVGGAPFTHRADVVGLYRVALQYIAVRKYLEANPPVDEEQVAALAELLDGIDDELDSVISDAPAYARRLVQAGVRAPEAGDDQ